MKRIIYKLLKSILPAMILMGVSCCTEGGSDDGITSKGQCEVTICMKSRGVNIATRDDSYTPLANELISSWHVFFVSADGSVAASVSGAPNAPSPNDEEKVSVAAGSYRIYAFANFSLADIGGLSGVTCDDKSHPVSFSPDFASSTYELSTLSPSSNIPMTGTSDVTIDSATTEISIEVTRLAAKVDVLVSNCSSSEVSVLGFSFRKAAQGAVGLFPVSPLKPAVQQYYSDEELNLLSSPVVLPADNDTEKSAGHIYIRETSAFGITPYRRFMLDLKITRKGNDETIHALLDSDEWTVINRNDWLKIPIAITDYVLELDAQGAAPIGGYPPMVEEENDEEYRITFSSMGRFTITPRVREAAGVDKWLPGNRVEINFEIANIADTYGVISDISIDPVTGALTGKLTGTKGTVSIPLTVTVKQDQSFGADIMYRRTVFVTKS